MATVDTNVLVRFLTADDEDQYRKSRRLFEHAAIFIPDTVMLETEWVLRYTYEFDPDRVCTAFSKVCGLPNVTLQNPLQISQAIDWHREGLNFADALHLAHSAGYEPFYTFDQKLIRQASSCRNVLVQEPYQIGIPVSAQTSVPD